MDNSTVYKSHQTTGGELLHLSHRTRSFRSGYFLLAETADKEHESITELITQWALLDSFYLIAGGEWLPDHNTLRRSVRRHTVKVDEALDRLILTRPSTSLQLLDLLKEADKVCRPILILDFLHLFYTPDVDLSIRCSILQQCCQHTRRLSISNHVVVLVQRLALEDYRRFFPILASNADEILFAKEHSSTEAAQGYLFQ